MSVVCEDPLALGGWVGGWGVGWGVGGGVEGAVPVSHLYTCLLRRVSLF